MSYRSTRTITRELVKRFIADKLRKSGHENWANDRQRNYNADSSLVTIHKHLLLIGDEFNTAYFNTFEDMNSTINVHTDDLKEVLYRILDVTFEQGIQWGRLVGTFVFASLLAVKAMDCERNDVVENIIQWTAEYLEDQRFSDWINQHGGWDGFVQFYKNPKLRQQDLNQEMWTKAYNVGAHVFTGFVSVANYFLR